MSLIPNLLRAAVAVVATPVALVADVLTLPASSLDPYRGPFDRTAKTIGQAGAAFDAAVKPDEATR